MSKEKTYLKWYNKVGYGSGDVAGNVVYALLTSFVMIYLTDTIGLNAGVIGVLIAVSKIFDGITDIIFGTLIDKTHTKMGKAKPWMLYGFIGCAITLIGVFAIPMNMDNFAQYAWFFICYTLLNSVFYTANNIAYSALTALITKNSKERVQMGSYRFIFAFGTSLLIQAVTFQFVEAMGGGANGWRTVAIIYAVIGLIVNTISALSVKELSDEELADSETKTEETKYSFGEAFKILDSGKHVWLQMILWSTWKGLGWGAIMYLAAIAGIDQEMYDAAKVDGAGRFQIIKNITIPSIMPTYFVMLMLSVANFLNNGMDQYFVFQNAFNKSTIQVLDLYVCNIGMTGRSLSLATAIGILKSIVSVTLLAIVNFVSKKTRGESMI